MKKIKIQFRAGYWDSFLVNEEEEEEDPIDFKLSRDLVEKCKDWKRSIDDPYYSMQDYITRLTYEIEGLSLVQRLLKELPRWVQLSYYSEFYKMEVFFY